MIRRYLAPTFLALAAALPAQGDPPARRQPVAPDLQAKIDTFFGKVVAAVEYYPFKNIAGWIGLDTARQLIRTDNGTPVPRAHEVLAGDRIVQLVFAPSGTMVATAHTDRQVVVWAEQAAGLERLVALPALGGDVTAMAFYPGAGDFATSGELVTGTADGTVQVWSVGGDASGATTATEVLNLPGHGGAVTQLVYSADGRMLATGCADGAVRLFDAQGELTATMVGHAGGVSSLAIRGDDERMLSLSGDGAGFLLNGDGSKARDLAADAGQRLLTLSFGPGDHILGEQDDQTIKVWDANGLEPQTLPIGTDWIEVRWGGDREHPEILVRLLDGNLRSFSGAGFRAQLVDPNRRQVELAAVTAMGESHALLSAAGDRLDLVERAPFDREPLRLALTHGAPVTLSLFSPDGTRAVTATDDGVLHWWEWYQRDPAGTIVSANVPFVVLWLVVAAVLFTLYMRFVNLRMFKHAIRVVAGKFSNPDDHGEVSHFQALSSALSATVGLGNIAGVAIAVSIGGPGATFWMIVAGLLGMTLKFTECTLGQKFRKIDDQGRVSGGPMHYLKDGLAQLKLGPLGALLAFVFTIFCIGGSLAGGNAFQVNQSRDILVSMVDWFEGREWVYGLVMAFLVGIVIIGGIKRIAQTAEKIVPTMCILYVLAALTIILSHITEVPAAIGAIFGSALSGDAMYGGAIGALIIGFKRAAFSNEAGVGSASIAHSAARTPYAVREGIVALLEPFIDTVVVCTMTALVIVITGVYDPAGPHIDLVVGDNGAALTLKAFQSVAFVGFWFQWVLLAAVILFAFSTMISWFYYGERCWTNLFGQDSSIYFKVLFLVFVVLGSVVTASNVLKFGDAMILLMAFPNILGLYFLGFMVRRDLVDYEKKLETGEIRPLK